LPSVVDRPLTDVVPIEFTGKLTDPDVQVKPLEAVNKFVDVIVFDVKAPEFTIDPDVKPAVHVIEFDVKVDVLLIVLDCNVFKVDGPKTFKELVRISSDFKAFEINEFLLNTSGIILFGNSILG
jgi:hypothetical protein